MSEMQSMQYWTLDQMLTAKGKTPKSIKAKAGVTLAVTVLSLSAFGQGITDTKTGFSWLNLTNTVGIAENQVNSLYPQYTIASTSQVLQLWTDAGLSTTPGLFGGTTNFGPVLKYIDAMGATSWQNGHPECFGLCDNGVVSSIDFLYNNGVPEYYIGDGPTVNPNFGWPGTGTYMYTVTPEPSIAGLLGFGLLMAMLFNKVSYKKP